jgi:hypothetical protein
VQVVDDDLPPDKIAEIVLITDIHHKHKSCYEKSRAIERIMATHPEMKFKEVAALIRLHPSRVTQLLSYQGLNQAWKDAYQSGAVSADACYAASKAESSQWDAMLQAKLSGSNAKELERMGRKTRNGTPTVKLSRIKIELASGVSVTFAGGELSLDEAIEAASEAHKLMKKGQEQGLTAKTIQKVSADRAKA